MRATRLRGNRAQWLLRRTNPVRSDTRKREFICVLGTDKIPVEDITATLRADSES